jgi:hypothetical protein
MLNRRERKGRKGKEGKKRAKTKVIEKGEGCFSSFIPYPSSFK